MTLTFAFILSVDGSGLMSPATNMQQTVSDRKLVLDLSVNLQVNTVRSLKSKFPIVFES